MNVACETGIQSHGPISGQPAVNVLFAGGPVPLRVGSTSASPEDAEGFSEKWQAILGGLQADLGGKDPQEAGTSGKQDVVIHSANSGAVPGNELAGMKDHEASVAGRFVLKAPDAPELPGLVSRTIPRKSTGIYLLPGSISNQRAERIGADDSDLHLQRFSGGNTQSAKLQTTADTNPSTSATNQALMLSLADTLPLDSVRLSANPSEATSSPRDVSIPMAKPTDNVSRNAAVLTFDVLANRTGGGTPNVSAGSNLELEQQTSSATLLTQFAPQGTGDELGQENRPISIRSENAVPASFSPSAGKQPLVHRSSIEGPVITGKNFSISSGSAETTFERTTRAASPSAGAQEAESFQRDRVSIGAAAMPLSAKTYWGIPSTHLNNSAAGTQTPGEFHVGQSATVPAAVATASGNGFSVSAQQQHTSAYEAFATIDAGTDDDAAKWVIAGDHRAEAGFQDPSLGWVSVRAQAGAGGVHAAVVPASDVAAQALSGHLAGLNAHMANQYEHLNPVTLSAPDTGLNSQNTGRETPQGDRGNNTGHDEQHQALEQPELTRAEPAPRSLRGVTEAQMPGAEMPAYAIGQISRDGHVSIIV